MLPRQLLTLLGFGSSVIAFSQLYEEFHNLDPTQRTEVFLIACWQRNKPLGMFYALDDDMANIGRPATGFHEGEEEANTTIVVQKGKKEVNSTTMSQKRKEETASKVEVQTRTKETDPRVVFCWQRLCVETPWPDGRGLDFSDIPLSIIVADGSILPLLMIGIPPVKHHELVVWMTESIGRSAAVKIARRSYKAIFTMKRGFHTFNAMVLDPWINCSDISAELKQLRGDEPQGIFYVLDDDIAHLLCHTIGYPQTKETRDETLRIKPLDVFIWGYSYLGGLLRIGAGHTRLHRSRLHLRGIFKLALYLINSHTLAPLSIVWEPLRPFVRRQAMINNIVGAWVCEYWAGILVGVIGVISYFIVLNRIEATRQAWEDGHRARVDEKVQLVDGCARPAVTPEESSG